MNEEEKKAIELLEDIKNNTWTTKYIMSSDSKNAKVLLNLIEKLQKELNSLKEIEQQDKIIDLMSEQLITPVHDKECIKQYFEKKVRNKYV